MCCIVGPPKIMMQTRSNGLSAFFQPQSALGSFLEISNLTQRIWQIVIS